jgi:hypothetical protein
VTSQEPVASETLRRVTDSITSGVAPDALRDQLARWAATAPAYRAYLERYRDKVRKKLRGAATDDAREDLRAELLFARLVLADRRFALDFEAHGAQRPGPDFTATFRRAAAFEIEVTRLRGTPTTAALVSTIAAKLRQLRPSTANVLVVSCDAPDASQIALDASARALRRRADAWDEDFFATRGLASRRAFYDRFLRLGAAIAWCPDAAGASRVSAWINPSARIPAPVPALRAVLDALRAHA